MNNVMIDLETLDTKATAVILSIGAVKFEPTGYDNSDTFYQTIDIQSCIDCGLTVSADTVSWWLSQSGEALSVFEDESECLRDALDDFRNWFPAGAKLWGNGASFDNPILSNAYSAVGIDQPWKFWNDRCYRTIAAMHPSRRSQQGTYHNALDDAKSQVEHMIEIALDICW